MGKKRYSAAVPYNQDAEESVIGTIINNADALKQVIKVLEPPDFYATETAAVFETCVSLKDSNPRSR